MTKCKRQRPTDRQLAELQRLSDGDLLERSLAAMQALNRRAKNERDRARTYRRQSFARGIRQGIEEIYSLKNSFLVALVESGNASVKTFTTLGRPYVVCDECGHSWVGDVYCYRCQMGTGEVYQDEEEWFVVEVGEYRFHQPGHLMPSHVRALATPEEAHEPTQPAREIPDIGLTIEAQHRCIKMMTARLLAQAAASPDAGRSADQPQGG